MIADQVDNTRPPLGCYDCGLAYGGIGWVDVLVPDDTWKIIAPDRETVEFHGAGGVLCFNCIARRLERSGLSDIKIELMSGPVRLASENEIEKRAFDLGYAQGIESRGDWASRHEQTLKDAHNMLAEMANSLISPSDTELHKVAAAFTMAMGEIFTPKHDALGEVKAEQKPETYREQCGRIKDDHRGLP